jgi:undecaprenyl-diphosphatase
LPLPEGFWLQAGIVAASIAVMVGLSVNSSLRQHRRATIWISSMSLLILDRPVYWLSVSARPRPG